MKNRLTLWLLASLLPLGSLWAQDTFLCKNGSVSFFSETPVEDISAQNKQATSYLRTQTGELVVQLLVKGFRFEKALMEEHFNENYIESDKYPKAEFKGKLSQPEAITWEKDGTYPVHITGTLTLHGKTKTLNEKASLVIAKGNPRLVGSFVVSPADFDIEIPTLVMVKIAKSIEVRVDLPYEPYSK